MLHQPWQACIDLQALRCGTFSPLKNSSTISAGLLYFTISLSLSLVLNPDSFQFLLFFLSSFCPCCDLPTGFVLLDFSVFDACFLLDFIIFFDFFLSEHWWRWSRFLGIGVSHSFSELMKGLQQLGLFEICLECLRWMHLEVLKEVGSEDGCFLPFCLMSLRLKLLLYQILIWECENHVQTVFLFTWFQFTMCNKQLVGWVTVCSARVPISCWWFGRALIHFILETLCLVTGFVVSPFRSILGQILR